MVTKEQLLAIMPNARKKVDAFLGHINAAMDEFEINTPLRQAMFLAQIGHESAQLLYVKELASGKAYEGRKDLGNTVPGYGVKYKGRGLIQVTGYDNYIAVMMKLGIDCVERPELLEEPANATRASAWWWKEHGCNQLADTGDVKLVTKRINGGYNGLEDRTALFKAACKALSVKV